MPDVAALMPCDRATRPSQPACDPRLPLPIPRPVPGCVWL